MLYVFFAVRHINREILQEAVTPSPTAEWTSNAALAFDGTTMRRGRIYH
jgi:hypothetical protein